VLLGRAFGDGVRTLRAQPDQHLDRRPVLGAGPPCGRRDQRERDRPEQR
jgi:hypothetical protein